MPKTRKLIALLGILLVGLMFLPVAGMPYNTMTFTASQSDPYIPCSQQTDIPEAECEALVTIYDATDGPNWSNNTGWLVYPNPCTWTGLACFDGHVTYLSLDYQNIAGEVPAAIGVFSQLKTLYANNNQLTALPPEIGNLSNLKTLSLYNNQLTALPPEIGNLSNLTRLYLNDNQLTTLPPEIGNLSYLAEFHLGNNELTTLPAEIGNINIIDLYLYNNRLSTLPSEIGNLSNLNILHLHNNRLTLPSPEIGSLGNLTKLYLSHNRITTLPSEIGNLSNLTELYLNNNNQITTLPPEIGDLSNLTKLYLNHNRITTLPPEIGNLSSLNYLYLSNNELTELPSGFEQLDRLYTLNLSHNQFMVIPIEIGLLTSIYSLYLNDNPLSGALPDFLIEHNLSLFSIHATNLCTPNDTIQNWLDTIHTLSGTGFDCDLDPGAISGVIALDNGDPAANTSVVLYRHTINLSKLIVMSLTTNDVGEYTFTNLGEGINYFVYVSPNDLNLAPQYYEQQITFRDATVISVTNGNTTSGIDFVLSPPQAALANVTADTGAVMVNPVNGQLVVTQRNGNRSAITVTRTVLCADDSPPTAVNLMLDNNSYPMSATGNTNEYSAMIPESEIVSGSLRVVATCVSGSEWTELGTITLFDPSGYITDSLTGAPIVGATVTLHQVPGWRAQTSTSDTAAETCESNESKASGAAWSQSAPTTLGEVVNADVTIVDPPINPQTTNNAGYYGWDVPAGCWYVVVTANDYDTLVSPVVGVPSEVTDLDLRMTKTGIVGYYLPFVTK